MNRVTLALSADLAEDEELGSVHGLFYVTLGRLQDAAVAQLGRSRAADDAALVAWEELCQAVPMIVTQYPAHSGTVSRARTTYRVVASNEEARTPGAAVLVELRRLDELALQNEARRSPDLASDLGEA